ncbi:hypothetical protein N9Z41_01885 [bacterium]|nr:hypothetical protein [bacterium]
MAYTKEIINVGSTVDDGTGDLLRDAFTKVNTNFTNIWDKGGVNSNLNLTEFSITSDGDLILNPTSDLLIKKQTIINSDKGNFDLVVHGDTSDNVLYVDADTNRVGILTSTPTAALDVAGSLAVSVTTTTGNLSVTGNTILGNDVADLISINGRIGTDILPSGSRSIGSTTNRYTKLSVTDIDATGTISGTFTGTIAPSTVITNTINTTSIASETLTATTSAEVGNLLVTGTLAVQGDSVTIDSATMQILDRLTFEGATADDFETSIVATDATADRTITLPDADGNIALFTTAPTGAIADGTAGQVLTTDGAGALSFTTISGGGGGIALTDLSVTVAAAGSSTLAYNSGTGAFTFTPPDLSTYLTSVPAQTFSSLTGTPTTIAGYGITDATTTAREAIGSGLADPEYHNGAIIDLIGNGGDFFKREVTVNGVRIVSAGTVGGQTAVPDAFVEKVARMFELFTDPNVAGINEASQRTFIKTLSGDAGTYHAAVGPTLQRVARGAGADYTPNFLTDEGIASWNLSPLFDTHVANDMVWYLNSTGDAPGDGDNDAQEVIEHVFHTLHMHGLDAVSLKMYPYISADWATGPLYAAMVEAYDAGKWDSSGYGGNAWKTDGDAFEVAAKEYLFLLNFGMFEYSSLWDGGSLSPEWTDDMRTQSGIQTNNPLGYALHNTYIAPVISKPSLTTIRNIFQDGDVGDPTIAGSSGYTVDTESSEVEYYPTTGAFTVNTTFANLKTTPTTIAGYGITDAFDGAYGSLTGAPTMYANSDVDTHLNTSSATTGQVLSWNGSDYAWAADATGGATSINTAGNTGTGSVTFASETLTATGTTNQINVDAAGFALSFSLDADLTGLTTINTHTIPSGTGTLALTGDHPQHTFVIAASGSTDYTFSDGDNHWFPTTETDPVLYLRRGETYVFNVDALSGSHPFEIRVSNGGSAYSTGVTNNGATSGNITFKVPMSAPATLYYQCTAHAGMGNTINIV